ncbi:DUF3618 domain-containing protein [Streptomyces sp. 142MFCol3.1]|uniref:DUF3618 domain-containing protein n=1 Tax=Streptomyces sp. 142MFCol3.1 TaxID=1172179 RepID=UPI0004100415|nr:DUF3618 domain-containing protein [Streptomyces sp. 142MFCol3.1]
MTEQPHDKKTAETPAELREQVEQTRHDLGETVAALAAKADVKARTQDKVAEVKDQAAAKAGALKAKATEAASRVQDKLPDPVKDKAAQATEQAHTKAVQAGRLWEEKAPEPLQARTAQGAQIARDNRGLLFAGVGAAVAAWLLYRHRQG